MLGLLVLTVPSNINMIPSPGMSAGLTFRRYCVIPWLQNVRGSLQAPRMRTAGTTIWNRFYSKMMHSFLC